ncbi:hypothetical protein DXA25_08750 [Ruminococcus bromii]|nr:hypothetical protein DXA25_08750 [Ruminococcus bromii]
MSVNGVAFGNGSTFTDKTTNAKYNSKWTSSTTLKATGGKYTFKFNTAKNTLTIEYLAPSKASIVGDINLDLRQQRMQVFIRHQLSLTRATMNSE